jgi:Mg2+/Co2+ transporter CorB
MAFFAASETAITVASRAKFHQLAKQGNKRAAMISELQKKLGLVLSVLIMCISMSNSIAVAFATEVFGAFYASVIMGSIILLFCEVMPKMLALVSAENLLLKSARILNFLFWLFYPLNRIINFIARKFLELFNVKYLSQSDYYATIEELKGMIDLHKGPGQDVPHERAMLKSILDLGSVQVSEIMVHRKDVVMLNADKPLADLMHEALASPHSRFPIWKDNIENIVGIIHMKSLLRVYHASMNNGPIEIMSIATPPWFIPESTDLLKQLEVFRQRGEHFSIVVDEYGALQGIVTLEDILEEIVGDITDEYDIRVPGVRAQNDGSYLVRGDVTIRDLNRQFEWDLPDEASTIAGLLLFQTRSIPQVKQVFILHHFKFEILRRTKNQITLIRLTPLFSAKI